MKRCWRPAIALGRYRPVQVRTTLEMLAVDDMRRRGRGFSEEGSQHALPFDQRSGAQVEAVEMQEIEGVIGQPVEQPKK